MPFRDINKLCVFQFESLDFDWLAHGLFTRRGGVSQGPFASLNVGATVGDDLANVMENRQRIYDALDRDPESSFDLWQVHSADVLVAEAPRQGEPYPKADGVVTNKQGITLSMRFADCVPIMLVDPAEQAIGMVHAGWQGTVRGAVRAGIHKLIETFGSQPADIYAGIGPCVRGHHYPVGPEVIQAFQESFGPGSDKFIVRENGELLLDLAGANRSVLRSMGVENIEDSGLCTACDLDNWFSHRGQEGEAGRFAGIMGLR